jgi:ribosomal protein S4E
LRVAQSASVTYDFRPERYGRILTKHPKLYHYQAIKMKTKPPSKLRDGAQCKVIGGTHEGKSGIVKDIKTGKTGYVSVTVVQSNGERFKTLAKNVVIQTYAA